ncbi:MAG: hypothetical protein GX957_06480 [Clostridiaceae bacterium]|nr:hypothetical protein [Clostridiaceae bacterium]
MKNLIFCNSNGKDYFIIAGDNKRALLRDMVTKKYVVANGLNWDLMHWNGGKYFWPEEFELASNTFLGK